VTDPDIRDQLTRILHMKLNGEEVPESMTDQLSDDLKQVAQGFDEALKHSDDPSDP
jgi:hypothetical protein